jgi:monothiol glutaredoxin
MRFLYSHKFFIVLNQPQSVLLKVLMMDITETIKEQIESNPILLYMKGSPNQPQCGFSAKTVQSLMSCGERFAFVDILSNPDIRASLPAYANWPTFPQLWVAGELVGGCDIVCEMFEKGELQTLVKEAAQASAENS